jgi:zinc and cadmium transporter
VAVSLLSLIGLLTFALDEKRLNKILMFMVSFAVGGLLGDVFIHIFPDIYGKGSNIVISLCVLGGIFLFFVLEKFIYWRHCHSIECTTHAKPFVFLNLIGDAVHNFFDGVIIGASYIVSVPLGFATTLAVVLHEIPHELGDYGVFIHGGLSRGRALFLNFICATFAIVGTILALAIGAKIKSFAFYAMPFTAGGFIYIAGSDLIPELHKEVDLRRSFFQLVAIVLGVGLMSLLLLLE